ncbi:hypothetical protein HYH03_006879 [Edaphochlamys debaryana]|uniref:Uncharacterized protein n=1 Tax=Edaphochlamys debaryana TaxID=47281 RepID=A0A835YCE5_9CHLO|nr:hypothetical protein HYH03_006879 [Edaphochlamys debaryana]|eukprot:KAG2494944.1 hypothetical protein HYH03_006879 [Edaphochlamys debaryana]
MTAGGSNRVPLFYVRYLGSGRAPGAVALEGRSVSFCALDSSCGTALPSDPPFTSHPWLGYLTVIAEAGARSLQWSDGPEQFVALLNTTAPQLVTGLPRARDPCRPYGRQPGRWAFVQYPSPELYALADLVVIHHRNSSGGLRPWDITKLRALYTRPYRHSNLRRVRDCQAAVPSIQADPAQCRDKWLRGGKKICTFGDSHMRILARALHHWSNSQQGDELPLYDPGTEDRWHDRDLRTDQARAGAGGGESACVRVVWINLSAEGFRGSRLVEGCSDLRLTPVIERFNLEARAVMRRLALPVVDQWAMTASLPESSNDGNHFPWSSLAGSALLDVVVQGLCEAS